MIRKILNPTDFSEASRISFDRAEFLANRLSAQLEVFHVLKTFEGLDAHIGQQHALLEQFYSHQAEHAKNNMSALLGTSRKTKADISFQFSRGLSVGNEIIGEAEKEQADLIVMGTHGEAPVRRLFLGSAAEYVVRYAPCPVLVLGRSRITRPGAFTKILLATDFSTPGHSAAKMALSLAKLDGAAVEMLHVVDELHSDAAATDRRLVEKMREFLNAHQKQNVAASTRIEKGRPSKCISEIANREGFDLIVMGTSGVRGLDRYILGSVAARVLRLSNVPVLITRVMENRVT